MSRGASPRSSRPRPEDPSIRRTWWLLSGAFFLLVLITGFRAIAGHALDWVVLVVVAIAAVAAIGHRNAVAGLEARGRSEAESFARILRGLSRSVSPDAIVDAIVDDLADGTGSDHVVVVRRSPDLRSLQATLVTRRAGVPSSTTLLPLADLEAPLDREAPRLVAVPIGGEAEVEADADAVRPAVATAPTLVAAPSIGPSVVTGERVGEPVAVAATGAIGAASGSDRYRTAARTGFPDPRARSDVDPDDGTAAAPRDLAAVASTVSTAAAAAARRGLVEARALLADLGIAPPVSAGSAAAGPRSEVVGGGEGALVTHRVAERVRAVYGLSHTLATPLPGEGGRVAGAIILSRRDREPWSDATRRLLVGAAAEASAALVRASSLREATARATTDPLTGLPNRRYFDEFCGLLARRRRAGDAVAVLMIDIDRFKRLNDTYGHPVGDEVLRSVAGAIAATVREEDVPARVGGEEFAVLLRNPGEGVAVEVGERVRDAVRRLDLREHGVHGVTVSVGAAMARGADEAIPAIIERADQALFRAKRSGRDRVVAG